MIDKNIIFWYNINKYIPSLKRSRFSLQAALEHPRSLIAGSIILLLVLAISFFFFFHSRSVLEQQLRDELRETAAVSALQFAAKDLSGFQMHQDINLPAYHVVSDQLNAIRDTSPLIQAVYIMRRTADPGKLQFVADADSLLSKQQLDHNHNGIIDPNEVASFPGDLYNISNIPALQTGAFLHPAVDDSITADQWGRTISGYAPIRDAGGQTVAVLGIDMDAKDFVALSYRIVSPLALIAVLCLILIMTMHEAYRRWKQRVRDFEELERERFALLDLMVHQLGTPLATFRWWLELLCEHPETASKGESCAHLQDSVDRMSGILASLLEASRVDKETFPYHAEQVSLRELLSRTLEETNARIARRKQRLTLSIDDSVDSAVIDWKSIEAVLSELLDNASSFSNDGQEIVVRLSRERNTILIDVEDHGCGISPKDMPRIGEKFVRGSNALTLKPVGNGLGLFIARRIVERAGGMLHIKSVLGQGTTVSFTVPLTLE
jgi:signal transduction histidine kinase